MKSGKFTTENPGDQISKLKRKVKRLEKELVGLRQAGRTSDISERDLTTILEKNADGIIIIDNEGLVQYVNSSAEIIFDRKRKNFIGIPFGFPLSNELQQEIIISKKNGTFSEAELRVIRINWKGKPGYQLSVRDISWRKHVEEEKRKAESFIQAAIQNIPLIFYLIDSDGKFKLSIGAGLEGLELEQNEVVGESVFELYRDYPEIINSIKKSLKGHSVRFESHIGKSYFDNYVIPYSNEEERLNGIVGVALDITWRKKTEVRIKKYNELLQEAQKIAHIGHWDLDITNNKLIWSDEIYRIFGITRKDFKGSLESFLEFVHPDDRERVNRTYSESIKNQKPYYIEHRILLKNGSVKYVIEQCKTYYNSRNQPIRSIGTVLDITERKKAEEIISREKNLLKTLIDNQPDYIYIKDIQGRFILGNTAVLRQFGLKNQHDLIGKTNYDFLPEEIADNFRKEEELICITGKALYDFEGLTIDNGIEKWISTNKIPIHDNMGKIYGFVCLGRDITERKLAEEKIRKLNADLERRIKERTAQLENANKELEAFAYSVSHDLRAPLRSINGFAEILKTEYEDKVDEEGKRVIGTIRRNALHMGQLIDDLLQFSRMGRSQISTTLIDTQKIVKEIVKELRAARSNNGLVVKVNDLHACKGDVSMIRQVWINLISNAIKYSQKREKPKIEIGSGLQDGEYVFYVKDNGTGFDMKYADKLFKVFQRLHTSDEFEGNGIGLALAKRIISKHGGRIWAEAKPEKGAVFYFSLPDKNQ